MVRVTFCRRGLYSGEPLSCCDRGNRVEISFLNDNQTLPEIEVIKIPIRNPHLPEDAQAPPVFKLAVDGPLAEFDRGTLCRVCQTFGSLLEELNAQSELADYVRSGAIFGHHKSIDDLRLTAGNGCPFCQLLLRHLESVQHGYSWFQEFHWEIPDGEIEIHQDWLESMDDRTRMQWSIAGQRSPAHRDLQFVPLPGER